MEYSMLILKLSKLKKISFAFQDTLLLNDNKLKTIPNELVACEALEKLHLHNNALDSIPSKLSAIVSSTQRIPCLMLNL